MHFTREDLKHSGRWTTKIRNRIPRARAPTFLIFWIMFAIRLLVCNLGVGFCNLRRGAAVRRFHERSRSYGGVVSFCRPSAVEFAFRNMSRTNSFIIIISIEIIEMKLTTIPHPTYPIYFNCSFSLVYVELLNFWLIGHLPMGQSSLEIVTKATFSIHFHPVLSRIHGNRKTSSWKRSTSQK